MTSSSSSSPEISSSQATDTQDRPFSYKNATHDEVLEDLSSRFILNLPDEELASLERICFQVEQAHWFYEDFIREENPKFPTLPLKKFSEMLFHACPLLHHWSHDHEQAFNNFMQYKTRVPVCGAIMLNETWEKCLLVKGWKASSAWGFPKGKINQGEPEHLCAIREVLEETGYNLADQINPEDVIEMSIKEQKISLYIVPNVPEDFEFETRTRKEISRIEWFKLTDLPTWKRNKAVPGKFYLISPFIGALKTFIGERKPRGIERKLPKPRNAPNQFSLTPDIQARTSAPSTTWTDANTQESSSQSSSPQTPSPKTYETLPEHTSNGQIASASTDDILEAQVLDPHFARLLSSLSMSSHSIVDGQAAHTLIPKTSRRDRTPSPTSATPVPSAVSSSNLRSVPSYSLDRADWSSHAPTRLLHRNGDLKAATVSSASSLARRDPPNEIPVAQVPLLKPSTRPPVSPSSHPETSQRPSPSGFLSGDPDPSSSTLSSSPHSLTSSSSYTPSSRRTSSTADISPYLSRPTEIPTLGKRLKQLALLERVADESMRMAPRLDHRPLPFGAHANPPNGAPQLCPPLHSVITRGAGVSQSVSQSLTGPRASDPSMEVMGYGQALTSDRTHIFDSRPFPHHFEIQDDPFQVRPRTSQALHRSPGMFSPTASLGRQSMNQHRLLSMINAPPLPSPAQAPSVYQGLPSRQLSHSVVHSLPFQSPSQTPARIPGPLHILPPYQFPSQQPSAVPPVSAPAKSSVFDIPPSTKGSSSLLSILNAGRGSRTGASTLT